MIIILIPLLAFVAGVSVHLWLRKEDRNREGVAETVTAWFLFSFVGITGLFAFMGHAFMADEIAESIGFAAGNPFQFEVAVANLALGALGLLCLHWRGNVWRATVITYSVFLWGAAFGHIYEMVVNNNHQPGNTGFALWADIATPLIAASLLFYYEWSVRTAAAPEVKKSGARRHLRRVA